MQPYLKSNSERSPALSPPAKLALVPNLGSSANPSVSLEKSPMDGLTLRGPAGGSEKLKVTISLTDLSAFRSYFPKIVDFNH
jgi:hypothetical protein